MNNIGGIFLMMCCFFSCTISDKNQKMENETLKAINKDMINNPYYFIPDLGDGYFNLGLSRISLYGNKENHVIVFEKTGYHNRKRAIVITLHYFGNCLQNMPIVANGRYVSNTDYIDLFSEENFELIEEDFELLSPAVDSIIIRGKKLKVSQDINDYIKLGIEVDTLDNPKKLIDFISFMRYNCEIYPELFRATEKEKREKIPDSLTHIMVINDWYHEYYTKSDDFLSSETMKLLIEVIENEDTTLWKPTQEPNNHWSNWLDSGNL